MNGAEALVPVVIFAGGFAMIFGIYYLRTRENLAMLEKGFNPRQYANRPAPFKSLKAGLLFLGAGLGLLLAYIIDLNMRGLNHVQNNDGPQNPAIYFALIAMGGGLGLIVSYFIEKKYLIDRKDEAFGK
jgi:hypothetical protein